MVLPTAGLFLFIKHQSSKHWTSKLAIQGIFALGLDGRQSCVRNVKMRSLYAAAFTLLTSALPVPLASAERAAMAPLLDVLEISTYL